MDNEAALEGGCVALGWSCVILRLAREVIAAARGCPPGYVDTIYGAELWAVQMVVIRAFPGSVRVLIDCESVRLGCQQGKKATTAAG